jgi:hypothetical protein
MALLGVVCVNAWARQPHYVFTLPPGYVGWIQIVFGDTAAPELQYKKKALTVVVGESGVCRTKTLFVQLFGQDEMFYRATDSRGAEKLVPLPTTYFINDHYHGGFGMGDTPDGSPGSSSWFFFVGPPDLRAKTPLADSTHETRKGRLPLPSVYPVPGRIQP